MTGEDITREEGLEGWEPYTNDIDIKVAVKDTCPKHKTHLKYLGFKNPKAGRFQYRAFAVCNIPGCDFYYEF